MNIIQMPLTEEEEIIYKWQYRALGGTDTLIMQAISESDEEYLDRFYKGFPTFVNGYRRYSRESGWWPSVQAKAKALGYLNY